MSEQPDLISIVVPVYNEEGNLKLLYERVSAVFEKLPADFQLILVNDGSRDRSAEIIHELHERDPRVCGILFSRNFGQDAALTAGLDAVQGHAAVLMDADLQDPPELIPAMIEKWKEGFDVVAARREKRRGETILKKSTSFMFYRVMRFMVGWEFPKDTGDFRLMDRKVVDAFAQCPQYNRFVRSLLTWTGFRLTTIGYERAERNAGDTGYTFWKSLALAITSITNFSIVPLRMATYLGFLIMVLSGVAMVAYVVFKLLGMVAMPGLTTLAISLWFLGGIQCLLLGVIGEYVGRTYLESQHRPIYIVREALGVRPAIARGADVKATGEDRG